MKNDLKPLFKKYETIIASSIVIIVVLFLTYFLLVPNFLKAFEIIRQQKSLLTRLENLRTKDTALAKIDSQSYKNNFSKISKIMPEAKDFVSLFNRFDVLQSQTQVTILRTDFQLGVVSTGSGKLTKAPGTDAYLVPMTFEALGDISSMQKFIVALSDLSGRLLTIDVVRVAFKSGNTIQASFDGQAYFYPLSSTIGSVEAPLPATNPKSEEILKKISQLPLLPETVVQIETTDVGKKDLFN